MGFSWTSETALPRRYGRCLTIKVFSLRSHNFIGRGFKHGFCYLLSCNRVFSSHHTVGNTLPSNIRPVNYFIHLLLSFDYFTTKSKHKHVVSKRISVTSDVRVIRNFVHGKYHDSSNRYLVILVLEKLNTVSVSMLLLIPLLNPVYFCWKFCIGIVIYKDELKEQV